MSGIRALTRASSLNITRRMVLTHVDLIEKLLRYNPHDRRKDQGPVLDRNEGIDGN